MKEQEKLYRYDVDFGRAGSIEGTFITTPSALREMCGYSIYFGEILGKHSEVECTFEESDFEVLTDDQDFIADIIWYGVDGVGHNPIKYYENQKVDG